MNHLYIFSHAAIHGKLNRAARAVPSVQERLGDPISTESYREVADNAALVVSMNPSSNKSLPCLPRHHFLQKTVLFVC